MRWFVVDITQGLVLVLGCASGAVLAQAAAPASDPMPAPAALPGMAAAAPAWRLPPSSLLTIRWDASSRPAAATPLVSVVEIDRELRPGFAPGRAHHALKIRAEWPRAALRSMGLSAAECTTQFRMPTSIGQSGGFGIDVRAQVRLACNY